MHRISGLAFSDFVTTISAHQQNGVFYMPSFGPVYSQKRDIQQFVTDVVGYWDNKQFLDYDKEKRWFDRKKEFICSPYITYDDGVLYIPVYDEKNQRKLKIYTYFDAQFSVELIEKARIISDTISAKINFDTVNMVVFKKVEVKRKTRKMYLKKIDSHDEYSDTEVTAFNKLSATAKNSFASLAQEEGLPGSHLLWESFLSKKNTAAEIFVATDHTTNQILGMIGPMNTLNDAWGRKQLLPPYFEVSPDARRQKNGSKLWKAAMNWGFQNGAEYLLVQAAENEPSDFFYLQADLIPCGTLHELEL